MRSFGVVDSVFVWLFIGRVCVGSFGVSVSVVSSWLDLLLFDLFDSVRSV